MPAWQGPHLGLMGPICMAPLAASFAPGCLVSLRARVSLALFRSRGFASVGRGRFPVGFSRFRAGPMGATIKLHTRVAIPMEVKIPAFTHRTLGAECSHHSYAVVACILHCGATADAGHYTVRYLNHMSPREAPEAPHQWIADDSKPAQSLRIRPDNDAVLGQQCYLALLCRTNQ